jgi:flagellar protein FliJ
MKAFRTLLKLASRDLETLRRALAGLLERRRMVDERILGHEQSLRAEQKLALKDYESHRAYSGFAVLTAQGIAALDAEGTMIDDEVARLRGLIAEAHAEKRKFERLIELEEAREKAKREKREDAELDEMATMRAGRMR